MKSAEWLAVFVLALMVGGIAFVVVYRGGTQDASGTPATEAIQLTFGPKRYPEEEAKVPVTEIHKYGHHDFWFYNDNPREVKVGLTKKGCTCSEVELALVPDDWKPRLLAEAAGRMLQRAPRGLDGLPTLAATLEPERVYPENLSETDVRTTPLTEESVEVVPAGALGWVRLRWSRPELGMLMTYAKVWVGQRDGSADAQLDIGTLIAPAVETNKELSAGTLGIRDLDDGKRLWIVCWSATRPSFHLKAEKFVEGKPSSDPVEVGDPQRLNAAQLRRLGDTEKLQILNVRGGYRIPVTLRAKAPDGTPFELGHFRRFVKLTSDDDGIEPMEVRVSGEVQGDVTVGDAKERGAINLGPFSRGRGARGSIVLHTDRKEVELKLDAARIPPYLKARLPSKAEETSSGHRMWVLDVEVPPDTARGEFPRSNDPVYLDSAIYVTTEVNGKPERSIRVPVMGTAND